MNHMIEKIIYKDKEYLFVNSIMENGYTLYILQDDAGHEEYALPREVKHKLHKMVDFSASPINSIAQPTREDHKEMFLGAISDLEKQGKKAYVIYDKIDGVYLVSNGSSIDWAEDVIYSNIFTHDTAKLNMTILESAAGKILLEMIEVKDLDLS